MAAPQDTLQELVNGYTWCVITTDAPSWYTCPVFRLMLGQEAPFEKACTDTPLSFPPSLLNVLHSANPPSLSFFRSLPVPAPKDKLWGVYCLLLERDGSQPKIYIGSGTNASSGIVARLKNYATLSSLPRLVDLALKQGYSISHSGLLCWAPIPPETLIPSARVRLVAVEATFAFIFHAGFQTKLDPLWAPILPWGRDTVGWLPLCTHTALMERPAGGHDMTDEQLVQYNAQRRARSKELMAIASKRCEDRQRADDLKGYLARKLRERLAWEARNKDRVLAQAAGVRARARASRRHECTTYGVALQSVTALAKHMASKAHQEQVRLKAGGAPKEVSSATMRSRRFAAMKKESKAYYCAICDKAFNIKGHLTKHNSSKKHIAKASAASA